MSKYDTLAGFLKSQPSDRVPMTFSEVENVLGFKLPASAKDYSAWWANEHSTHVQARAWMNAGFESEYVDLTSQKLVFKRVGNRNSMTGMGEGRRAFAQEDRKLARHPALGAMKGTFTIEPGYDLARSPFSAEELAEMDANLDRTADLIDAGMNKKP